MSENSAAEVGDLYEILFAGGVGGLFEQKRGWEARKMIWGVKGMKRSRCQEDRSKIGSGGNRDHRKENGKIGGKGGDTKLFYHFWKGRIA